MFDPINYEDLDNAISKYLKQYLFTPYNAQTELRMYDDIKVLLCYAGYDQETVHDKLDITFDFDTKELIVEYKELIEIRTHKIILGSN